MNGPKVRRLAATAAAVGLSAGLVFTGLTVSVASAAATPGLTGTSITIGGTEPLTGPIAAGYSEVSKAANAVFKYLNAKPAKVNGRKINYIIKDDCYDLGAPTCPTVPGTVSQTNALLATSGGLFSTFGSLGTPTQDKVRGLLKSSGTPQLLVNSGSKDWNCQSIQTSGGFNCPALYPQLTGYQPSYNVEGKILGKYIAAHLPGKVCFLGQNDDFGIDGHQGLSQAVSIGITSYYNPTAVVILGGKSALLSTVQSFKTGLCKVLYLDTIPAATAGVIADIKQVGSFAPKLVISSVGSDPITVAKVLGGGGTEVGAVSFAPIPASTDPSANAKLWRTWMTKVIDKDSADFPKFTSKSKLDGNMATGASEAVAFAETLYAMGKPNFTQAQFVAKLLSTSLKQTPSLLALQYSGANHQGLLGGYVDKVASTSATAILDSHLWQSDNGNGPVVAATAKSSGMPAWLK
jgi:branched-chain amino acid transport system substrate-binding protein